MSLSHYPLAFYRQKIDNMRKYFRMLITTGPKTLAYIDGENERKEDGGTMEEKWDEK